MRQKFTFGAVKAAKALVVLSLVASLPACERAKEKLTRNSLTYEGVTFRPKVEKFKESPDGFP